MMLSSTIFTELHFRVQLLFSSHKHNLELIKLHFFEKENLLELLEALLSLRFIAFCTLTLAEESTGDRQLFWQNCDTQFSKVLKKSEGKLFCSDISKIKQF